MLSKAASYFDLCSEFCWDIPARYNMGADVCDRWAEKDPDRTAIIDLTSGSRQDISFLKLKKLSDALVVHLRDIGIVRGDRIGVYRSQSIWTAVAHVAIWKLGAISIPLFKLFGEEALETRLADSEAVALITDLEGEKRVRAMLDQLPGLLHILVPEKDAIGLEITEREPVVADTTPDDPAIIIYTSGTTGAPKGALHGHRVLLGHLPGVEMSHDRLPQKGDVLWTPADWAWIGGLFDVLMPGLYHGVPVVAARMEKFSAEKCKAIIHEAGVRNVFFPPTALKLLKAEGAHIKGMRSVASGGEPLGEEMLNWGKDAFGLTINEFYGQTECNMVVSSSGSLFEPVPGAIGKPVPGHTVEVIDAEGEPTNDEGDIAIKRGTPVMMLEYWKNPTATKAKFRGAWMLTGDRGIREGDFIRFIARDDDVITSAGYRIGPGEIENCLLKHEAVASAGVVGKPDPLRTQIVKAYVLLKPGHPATADVKADLQAHVKERLAAHEYPREIEFVDALPMTVTGKIIRKKLKEKAVRETEQPAINGQVEA